MGESSDIPRVTRTRRPPALVSAYTTRFPSSARLGSCCYRPSSAKLSPGGCARRLNRKRYLVAIARSGTDFPRTAALAKALGSNPQPMAPHRDSCIRKGLIWSPALGLVAFTVPGMADFIRRQHNAPVI